jgi:hypothetical protein
MLTLGDLNMTGTSLSLFLFGFLVLSSSLALLPPKTTSSDCQHQTAYPSRSLHLCNDYANLSGILRELPI